MKWRAVAALVTTAIVGGIVVGIVAAAWSGTQKTSGFVSATTTSSDPNLYICEPVEQPAGAVPNNDCNEYWQDVRDDDEDGYINDGCPAFGYADCDSNEDGDCDDDGEAELCGPWNYADNDQEGRVNDGCPVVGPEGGEFSLPTDLGQCDPAHDDDGTLAGPPGADEAIFEDDEGLLPGQRVWDRVRLRNQGGATLVILGAEIHVTETSDPGDDCCEPNECPIPYELWNEWEKADNVKVWILGKWTWFQILARRYAPWRWVPWWDAWVYTPHTLVNTQANLPPDDWYSNWVTTSNPNPSAGDSYELETFTPTVMDGKYRAADCDIVLPGTDEDPETELTLAECEFYSPHTEPELRWKVVDYSTPRAVHIPPGDYEDMAISVRLPYDVPVGCEGNEWNIEIEWIAVETAP